MLPQYAAPEIFDRQATYTQAVDMWSLGVSLYAMSVIITQSLKTKKLILTNKLQQPALQALWTTALRCGGGLQQAPVKFYHCYHHILQVYCSLSLFAMR